MLKQLEILTDELTSATYKAQALLTDFGLECENAELDGITLPAELSLADQIKLASIKTSTQAVLRYLTELE